MRGNWQETLSSWMAKGLPLFVSLLWLMLSSIPLCSEIAANARPMVGVICIYFWTVYRPDLFNLFSVFILGLVSDIMSIAPFGIYLLLYLVTFLFVTNLIKYINEKTFEIMWIGLALLLPFILFVGWFMASVYYASFLPIKAMIFSYFLSVFLYPVIGGINALVVNACLQDDTL